MAENQQPSLMLRDPALMSSVGRDIISTQQQNAAYVTNRIRPNPNPYAQDELGQIIPELPVELGTASPTGGEYRRQRAKYNAESTRADRAYSEYVKTWSDEALLMDAADRGQVENWYIDPTSHKPIGRQPVEGATIAYRTPDRQTPDGTIKEGHWIYDASKPVEAAWIGEGERERLQKSAIPKWENLMPPTRKSSAELDAEIRDPGNAQMRGVLVQQLLKTREWEARLKEYDQLGIKGLSTSLKTLEQFGPTLRALSEHASVREAIQQRSAVMMSARELMAARQVKKVVDTKLRTIGRDELRRIRLSDDPDEPLELLDSESDEQEAHETVLQLFLERTGRRITDETMVGPVFTEYKRRIQASQAREFAKGFVETREASAIIDQAMRIMDAGRAPFFAGAAGVSKTNMAKEIASRRSDKEPIVMDMTPETSAQDIRGGMGIKGGDTTQQAAGVIKAMQEGRIAILNEINVLQDKTLLYEFLNLKPGERYSDGTYDFVIAEGFGIIGTLNVGYDTELSSEFGHVDGALEKPFRERGEFIFVYPPDHDLLPTYFDRDLSDPLVNNDGSTDAMPVGWLELMAAAETTNAGLFLPESAPRIAGLTQGEFVRLMCLAHTVNYLSLTDRNEVEQAVPDLFSIASGGPAQGGNRRGHTPLIAKEGMSPRTVTHLLKYLQGDNGGIGEDSPVYHLIMTNPSYTTRQRLGVNGMLEQFIANMAEKTDRDTMERLAKSFGFLGEPANRSDYTMPELYTNEREEVLAAYKRHEALRGDSEEAAVQQAKGGLDALYELTQYEVGAKKGVAEALKDWGKLNLPNNPPGSYDELLARSQGKEKNLVLHLKDLMETRRSITSRSLEDADGGKFEPEIVLMPAGEMRRRLAAGDLGEWLRGVASSNGMNLSFESITQTVFKNPNIPAYVDPSGGPNLTMAQHLDEMIAEFGDWVPILSAPLDRSIRGKTGASAESYGVPPRVEGFQVSGGVLEAITTWLSNPYPKSPTLNTLRLLGSTVQSSSTHAVATARVQGNGLTIGAASFTDGVEQMDPYFAIA